MRFVAEKPLAYARGSAGRKLRVVGRSFQVRLDEIIPDGVAFVRHMQAVFDEELGAGLAVAVVAAVGLGLVTRGGVEPILSAYCYACHGPDEETIEGDTRLDIPGEADLKEVVARIRAVTRRCGEAGGTQQPESFRMDDLEVFPSELRARRGEKTIDLSLRDVKILELLHRHRGEVLAGRQHGLEVQTIGLGREVGLALLLHHEQYAENHVRILGEQFPEEMLALFGGGDMSTPEGFYQIEMFGLMIPIGILTATIAIGTAAITTTSASSAPPRARPTPSGSPPPPSATAAPAPATRSAPR